MPRVRCAGHVMTCGACSCFNLGNSLPVALGPACARTDTTMTTEDRCTTAAVCMHISYAAHQTSTLAHLLATFGSRHALLGDLAPANPWGRMDSAATFSHSTPSGFRLPQFASHDTRRHFGLWFWRPGPISSVEVCGFVKKPSSADQLRSQPRRVQLIRGCLGLEGIRRA